MFLTIRDMYFSLLNETLPCHNVINEHMSLTIHHSRMSLSDFVADCDKLVAGRCQERFPSALKQNDFALLIRLK